ncbi:MAG: PorP/SprF family type IX secretion system membrane protein [Crocinitomicaceae bacterium]|jgi:type IX secretion system PorP/SprF family membrane protein|nr:PorP/SprF family type IX secretion system membrane protein [Crocinitomicaceae bacterium]
MKKTLITFALAVAASAGIKAQQLPLFSQYYYNRFIYNPAFTGVEDQANAFLIHRSQWKDIAGAPVTYALTVDGPVSKNKIGLGLSLFNDQMDIFNRTGLYSSYSYRFTLTDGHDLTLGLSAGVIDNKIDFTNVSAHDANDPTLYNQTQRKVTVDANFGIAYMWQDLKVGVSMPQILGNKINYLETNTNVYTTLKRHLIAGVSYDLTLSESAEIDFYPSVMMRYVKGAPVQFDINANFAWKDMLRAGVSYRLGYAVGFNIGAKLNKNLIAGYTYELVVSPIGNYSGGGHEVMLGFTFGGNNGGLSAEELDALNSRLDNAENTTDSLANELNKKDQQHDEEIEKLHEEIEILKLENDGAGNPNDLNGNQDNSEVRIENAADFVDEAGQTLIPGFYVIMGAFKNKDNALNAKKQFQAKYPAVIIHKQGEFYYVNVFYTVNEAAALQYAEEQRKIQPDVWVFQLK